MLNQANIFIIFIFDGILIGIMFDAFRISRRIFKTSDIITYAEDILFWILTGLLLLYSIFIVADGEIRFYMFLAAFCGVIFYMLLFSKYFIKIGVKFFCSLNAVIAKIFKTIFTPIKWIFKSIQKLFFKPINFIVINIKKMQKNNNFLKNKKDFTKKCRKI